jgi:DNA modification methylase
MVGTRLADSAASVLEQFTGLTPDPEWAFARLTQAQTSYATHGYHRYPAKFIPQLAARLIEDYSQPGDTVLDPFMGSGTTLVEAKRLGRPSVGVDINPVAHLVAEAKTRALEPSLLQGAIACVHGRVTSSLQPSLFSQQPLPTDCSDWHERLRYWFRDDVLQALSQIQCAFEPLGEAVQPFFRCALSHTLKPVSWWHDRSVKPMRKLDKPIPDPVQVFFRHVRRMARGNREYWELLQEAGTLDTPAHCYCADARALLLPDHSVDLIVTSPPYVTSYEYADLHQLSALWFQMTTDLREFRQGFIGRSNGVHEPVGSLHSPLAEAIVTKLSAVNPRKAREVALYFAEMYACFTEWQRVMRSGGYACIVIGNTHLSGVEVQNAQVFAEQLMTLGFVLERVILREIPSKILPRTRDKQTGKFTKTHDADYLAYPTEYIIVFRCWKE